MHAKTVPIVKIAVGGAALLLLAACATVPEPLEGDFEPLTPDQSADQHVGQTMRWGGQIIDTRPGREETCVEILGRDLDARARPVDDSPDRGRFLACRSGFKDPAIFESGRDITVTGQLDSFVEGTIGEFNYIYPRLAAEVLFLWNERQQQHYHYYDPWWPYYGPYRYYAPYRYYSPYRWWGPRLHISAGFNVKL